MALVAEIYNGSERAFGEPESLEESGAGLRGHRTYIVNTHDVDAAYNTAPPVGQAWSGGRPELVLYSKRTRYIGGRNNDSGENGRTAVDCEYQTPSLGNLPPPTLATKYSVLASGSETQTVYFAVGAPVVGPNLPIANGEGAGKRIGMVSARIYTYFNLNATVNWGRLIRLTRKNALNDAAISIPRLIGTGTVLSFAAGQVRYEGFTPSANNELLEIVHDVSFAEDFDVRWYQEDENGYRVGAEQRSKVYELDDLSGIW